MKVLNYDRVIRGVGGRKDAYNRALVAAQSAGTVTIHKANQREERPIVSIILLDWECREHYSSLYWLNQQDVPRSRYELIWIELYNQVVAEVTAQVDCHITCGQSGMYHKHLGYNTGILNARGDIVTICDSDAVFPPDFISSITESFEYDADKGCQRSLVLMHHEMRSSFLFPEGLKEIDDVKSKKWKWWPLNPNAGACMSVRKSDAIRYGAFDEHDSYRGYLCGPYELGWRLVNAGMPEVWYDHTVTALWHYAHPDPVGVNGLRASINIIFENTYPHVDLHAIKAVEAFSAGKMLPLKENPKVFDMRMKDRVIGTNFEERYSDMTGPEGFPQWLLWCMTIELFISLSMQVVVVNILRPAIVKTLKLLLGKRLYKFLRSLVYGDYEEIDINAMPELIDSYLTYNLIEFRGAIYCIPMSLGNVDFKSKKQLNRKEILKGSTIEDARIKIEESGRFDPELINSLENYNIIKYGKMFYALPMSIGQVDFTNETQLSRTEILKGTSFDEVFAMIEEVNNLVPVYVCPYEAYYILKYRHSFYAVHVLIENTDCNSDSNYEDTLRTKTKEELIRLLDHKEVIQCATLQDIKGAIDDVGLIHPRLLYIVESYNVIKYNKIFYILPAFMGEIDFNDENQLQHKEIFTAATYDAALTIARKRNDLIPKFAGSYGSYNVITYNKIFYILPASMGEIDFNDKKQRQHKEISTAATYEQALIIAREREDLIPKLIYSYESYNVITYNKLFYIVPTSMGEIDFNDENQRQHKEISTATTYEQALIIARERNDLIPALLFPYKYYNVVKYNKKIYATPSSMGNIDFTNKEQLNAKDILRGDTQEEVIALIEEVCRFIPELIDTIDNYNVIKYNKFFYGLPASLGKIDFSDKTRLTHDSIIIGTTHQETAYLIREAFNILPLLVCSYMNYNIVKYRYGFYAIPKPLERADFIYKSKVNYHDILREKPEEELVTLLQHKDVLNAPSYDALKDMIDGIARFTPELVDSLADYNVVRYKKIFYALPKSLGGVDFTDETQTDNDRIIKGAVYDNVLKSIQQRDDVAPELFCSYQNNNIDYNIVMYKEVLYAVPKLLGAVDFTNDTDTNSDEILKAKTKEELLQAFHVQL
ncbi:Glycosyl transferase, family 2 domain protein [Candidatus Magnetobacterium bavaricum]|uniref:Glycosyl transferase, family 2 domain protein n=1 Tax=Candidatus Magnetobacterium bavaricum TaxID=29290 RepID=A0A0F3GR55_9BACT|nr:Glycosyl transferase, family 2 domain protein [Candidatus Magnetobacterium bavaricum]